MKFKISIFGQTNTVKNYRIDFDDPNVGIDFVIGQTQKVWNDLRDSAMAASKIILHGTDAWERQEINTETFYSPRNSLQFVNGMVDLALYRINKQLVNRVLRYLLLTYEIKAGFRTAPSTIHPFPHNFTEFHMAPFSYQTTTILKNAKTDVPDTYFEVVSSSNIESISRRMCSFSEIVSITAMDLAKGLIVGNKLEIPQPGVSPIFLRGVLKEAGQDVNTPNITALYQYANLLLLTYAMQVLTYDITIKQIDQDDFWTALDAYAFEPNHVSRAILFADMLQDVFDAMKPYLKLDRRTSD